jgi:hypothetical protein
VCPRPECIISPFLIIIQESICSVGVIHKWKIKEAIKCIPYEGMVNLTFLLDESGNQVKKHKKFHNIKEAQ